MAEFIAVAFGLVLLGLGWLLGSLDTTSYSPHDLFPRRKNR